MDHTRVYPNPFSNTLNVTFADQVNVSLTLTDMLGKVRLEMESQNTSAITLDLITDPRLPEVVFQYMAPGRLLKPA